mmetsp:Transcript_24954/g.81727  ORF Transcript_24954/g.81727 Transcript_24954/m.81727 type:complete len:202 (+) Transcript_24954:1380-1985(+)
MYGGLVIPILSMHDPSDGSSFTRSRSSAPTLVPMSRPYAPVSSDVSQISVTPSATTSRTRFARAAGSYDNKSPLACLVLQYVQALRQPELIGIISTRGFLRIFGRSNRGKPDFFKSWTVFPASVCSTASTTRSICSTPRTDTPSRKAFLRSPCGTQPLTMTGVFCACARVTNDRADDSLGPFTVQLFTNHTSAPSGVGVSS